MPSAGPKRNVALALGAALSLAGTQSHALAATPRAPALPTAATASDHSLTIAGAVSGSSICNNCVGLNASEVGALLKAKERGWRNLSAGDAKLIERLQDSLEKAQEAAAGFKEKQTITDVALKGFFATLGKENPPAEQLPQVLGQIAGGFILARAGTATQPTDTPEVAALRSQARAALDANRDSDADAFFARIAQAQRSAMSPALDQLAATIAKRGDLAIVGLRYHEAADFFGQAAAIEPNERIKNGFEDREAEALAILGQVRGDNVALQRAIEIDRDLLARRSRAQEPALWADTLDNLAVALETLGARQTSTDMLRQAVAELNQVLLVRTRDQYPAAWARAEDSLGNALKLLSDRESGTDNLRAAAQAFNAALLERSEEREPLAWAMTQNNLGIVLENLGQREAGEANLRAAIEAFRAALQVERQDRYPVMWGQAESNLGIALLLLGERESNGLDNIRAAVAAFRAAITGTPREMLPLGWADGETNLGNALAYLDARTGVTADFPAAVDALQKALLENTRERDPVSWALTQADLGIAYDAWGNVANDPTKLKQAVDAYRQAMSVYADPAFAARAATVTQAMERCNIQIALLSARTTAKP